MANEELRIWGIHTTDDSLFLHDNVVAIAANLKLPAKHIRTIISNPILTAKKAQCPPVRVCCIVLFTR